MKTKQFSVIAVSTIITIALVALSITACQNPADSGGSGGTPASPQDSYIMTLVVLNNSTFTGIFGAPIPTRGHDRIISDSKAVLESKFTTAKNTCDDIGDFGEFVGISYPMVEEFLNDFNDRTSILNALKSNGYTVFAYLGEDYGVVVIKITTLPAGSKPDRYRLLYIIGVTNTSLTDFFGVSVPASGRAQIITGTKAVLESKLTEFTDGESWRDYQYMDTIAWSDAHYQSYSSVEYCLQKHVEKSYITAGDRTSILNALKTNGYTVFTCSGEYKYSVTGIFKQ